MKTIPYNSSNKDTLDLIRFLLVLISGTVLLSAIITPFVFRIIHWLYGENPWPFSRVYDRVALGVALLIVVFCHKNLPRTQIRTIIKDVSPKNAAVLVAVGAVISLTTALAGLPSLVSSGQFIWNDRTIKDFLMKFLYLLPIAVIISLLEEFFFRVVLFLSLCKRFHWLLAAFVSSALYSVVHFVQPLKSYTPTHSILIVGFDYTVTILGRLFTVSLLPALFGLFLTGIVLCIILRTSKSFYICVGLHTGWILAMKLALFATIETDKLQVALGASRRYLLAARPDGWISIIAAFAIVFILVKLGILAGIQTDRPK